MKTTRSLFASTAPLRAFTIKIVEPQDKEQKKKKPRRTKTGEEEGTTQRINLQISPFVPYDKFKTHETIDLYYHVDPAKEWTERTRYNSFIHKCSCSYCVHRLRNTSD
jgi:hypothetical protein